MQDIKYHKHDLYSLIGFIGCIISLLADFPGVIDGLFWAMFLIGLLGSAF